MKRFTLVAAVAAIWLLSGVFGQAQNQKAKYYRIVCLLNGKVLDVKDGSKENEAKIVINAKSDSESQQWEMVKVGDYVKFINRKSGKALDVPSFSKDEGADLIQWEDNGGDNQQWKVEKADAEKSDKGTFIKSRHSDLVLDVAESSMEDGARVIQYGYHGEKNQLWELVEVK
jgi:hypothetical protein